MTTFRNEAFEATFDTTNGIATLTWTMPGKANKVDPSLVKTLGESLDWAQSQPDLKGLILTSGHKNFCVGADIDGVYAMEDAAEILAYVTTLNRLFRRLETLGVPVVAALTGSALGGGFELALSCHRRFALADESAQFGLPEVTLGLIPGAGGTQRLARLIGAQAAMGAITQGQLHRATKAKAAGFIHELYPTREALFEAATTFILANPGFTQPWDQKGFRYPGIAIDTGAGRGMVMAACAEVFKRYGKTMPHLEAAICAIQEGLLVDLDNALKIEARYFTYCATQPSFKAITGTFWYHRNASLKGEGQPQLSSAEAFKLQTVGILGSHDAAFSFASVLAAKGFSPILWVASEDALSKAQTKLEALGDKVRITTSLSDLANSDLVLDTRPGYGEAHTQTLRELEPQLPPHALWASTTGAIPLNALQAVATQPARIFGFHAYSPAERTQLFEVAYDAGSNPEDLARLLAFARKLGKMAITVKAQPGFYLQRLMAALLLTSLEQLQAGVSPALLENAALQAGLAHSPLHLIDLMGVDATLGLLSGYLKGKGQNPQHHPALGILTQLMQAQRLGVRSQAGFYDHAAGKATLWSGLANVVPTDFGTVDAAPISHTLLTAQANEALAVLHEGLVSERDLELGAVFGMGFPLSAGGPLLWSKRHLA